MLSTHIPSFFFFFNDTATTEIYTLSLHDALPICAMEQCDLGTRILQRLQKAPSQLLGTQGIHQQAHLYACAGPLYQQVAQGRAGLVRLEDVVLQVDVVARRVHRLDDGVEGGSAAHQQPQVGGRADGKVAGGRHQPRDRSEEHTSELQSRQYLVCRLLLEKKKRHDAATVQEGG